MSSVKNFDVVILGGGIVGLSLAKQLLENRPALSICILDKECSLACHNSGRNSGVLHAGIYYKPDSLKAKVCVKGARRLRKWILKQNLPLNQCGKIILPTAKSQDSYLEILLDRGLKNGANVEIVNDKFLHQLVPCARSSSNRALYSPNTCVTAPKLVMQALAESLTQAGVELFLGTKEYRIDATNKTLQLPNGEFLSYGYLVNSAGVQALDIARIFSIGDQYKVMPFKGNYWSLRNPKKFGITTNLYPVPDLNVPFLGVHFTPSALNNEVYIGPTATLALGKENYKSFENIDLSTTFSSLSILSKQFLANSGNIRKYVQEQSLMWSKYIAIHHMRRIVPSITLSDIVPSSKVGIRPQLFDVSKDKLEDDLVCISDDSSIHVLNAISPAFTASFELADHIISTTFLSLL